MSDDGGPAFTTDISSKLSDGIPVPHAREKVASGMSLRDWFAGHVMKSIIEQKDLPFSASITAQQAYNMADAMLDARED